MFLGDEAARSEWLDIASVYIKSAEHYVGALKRWPSSLRSLVYPFVHGRRQMRTQFNQGRQIVSEALRKKRTTAGAATTCNPPSLLDLFSSGKFADSVHNDEEHAVTQMNLCVAAIQAQSATVMQCVVDLSAYPEYVPELREEIEAALRSTNGEWNKDSLGQLLKLDSFLKETQRLNSPDLISLQRKTRDPLKLSNGLHLPKGITLLLPTGAINMDPAYFDSPEQFDGFRYYKQRLRSEDDATRHQLVTVGKKDLAWGYGRHACPGRFMADVVMKMIMVEFVMRYDIRAPSSGVARPENIITEGILAPDPNWEVALKQRL
ncbi:cytochrome P450 [Aspergillus karnatakaensis]|uniref:cytochrome P450 n=1 Tax=Aspergillus karnatakaensis TaxID=1810916 RepID=UPI003CCDF616